MVYLTSPNLASVHGAMLVLGEFVRDDISDLQFPIVAPILLPALYNIYKNDQVYNPKLRSKAVSIVRDFIEMIYMVKDEYPDAVSRYLNPILSVWMPDLIETMQLVSDPDTSMIKGDALKVFIFLL
jgi:hypothetical protein